MKHACPRSPAAGPRAGRATDQSAAGGCRSRSNRNSVAPDRITLRTTFRDTRSSRQVVFIGLFWAKYARRIFAIVSTTSIPNLAPVSPRKPLWTHCLGGPDWMPIELDPENERGSSGAARPLESADSAVAGHEAATAGA